MVPIKHTGGKNIGTTEYSKIKFEDYCRNQVFQVRSHIIQVGRDDAKTVYCKVAEAGECNVERLKRIIQLP